VHSVLKALLDLRKNIYHRGHRGHRESRKHAMIRIVDS
jgi:hypothetical protein